MPRNVTTGTTAIKFGSNLRIGYRLNGSNLPFTYVGHYPAYNELPYTFALPDTGDVYEIEYTELCPNCSGPRYSPTVTTTISFLL